MVDHEYFLEILKYKVKKCGFIIGSVPNIRHLHALTQLLIRKTWEYKEEGIFDKTHLRFFTERSLQETLQATGWTVELLVGINSSQYKNSFEKRIVAKLLTIIFGKDIQFVQFGFRAKLSSQKVKPVQERE